MDHLVYGMEFSRQLSNLPAPWFLENMLLPLARKISPSLRVGTLEDPFFFSPIITASQVRRTGHTVEAASSVSSSHLTHQCFYHSRVTSSSLDPCFKCASNSYTCQSNNALPALHRVRSGPGPGPCECIVLRIWLPPASIKHWLVPSLP